MAGIPELMELEREDSLGSTCVNQDHFCGPLPEFKTLTLHLCQFVFSLLSLHLPHLHCLRTPGNHIFSIAISCLELSSCFTFADRYPIMYGIVAYETIAPDNSPVSERIERSDSQTPR